MVLVAFVCIVFAFGASMSMMPLIYGEAIREFGWSRTDATLIFTYKKMASAAVALFLVGPLCEKFGVRHVMLGGLVITGLAMISFIWVDRLETYYLAGAALGLGVMSVLVVSKVMVCRWFVRDQGLAIGITLASTSAGGLVFPLVGSVLIESLGWRAAFASLSLGVWLVALPLFLLLAKERPSDEIEARLLAEGKVSESRYVVSGDAGFTDLLRGATFWMIAVSVFLIAAVDAGVFQHTILFLESEAGISGTAAAVSISATFGIGLIAKVAAGKCFDRLSVRGISLWYLFLAVSIALAIPVSGMTTLIVFTIARGIAHGGLVTEAPILAKHCYGPRLMNMTLPVIAGIWAVGAALGPTALSVIYEATGSYFPGFLSGIGASIVAAVILYRVRPARRARRDWTDVRLAPG